ncbi:MAG TPA: type I phosphomannose isomerase catalytic subunit, partial [Isosphaeraceae bacterium]|nr:type I phosphomannose isomerase catalytic subunit [Isosphaeraceae bacterium]
MATSVDLPRYSAKGTTIVPRMAPLRFEPILKRILWGGRRLETVLGKPLGDGHDHAESWEVADHRLDVSQVAEGPLSGMTLRDLIHQYGKRLLGEKAGSRDQFPLLVKFLDAHQDLSVQVHPDDELGRVLAGDNGK